MILDGSMGALIYTYKLTEQDVRGSRFARHSRDLKNCTEVLVATQPRLIEEIHRAYLEAGADIIETDTFNGTALSLEEFGLQGHVHELNRTAAVRRRQHRPDQETALDGDSRRRSRPARCDIRRDGGELHDADPGAGGGRSRPAAAGNLVRHAGAESLPVRH